jgi:hypothetical protein
MTDDQQPTYTVATGAKQQPLIPKQFQPTKRFGAILGIITLGILILGVAQFPLGAMLSGNTDISIEIGYPYPILQLSLENPKQFPLNIYGLLIDLIIYAILTYAIDIMISIMLGAAINKKPSTVQTFKPQISQAEKITKRILEKTNQKPLPVPTP